MKATIRSIYTGRSNYKRIYSAFSFCRYYNWKFPYERSQIFKNTFEKITSQCVLHNLYNFSSRVGHGIILGSHSNH